jgi:hypothetical protein
LKHESLPYIADVTVLVPVMLMVDVTVVLPVEVCVVVVSKVAEVVGVV